MSKVKNFLRKFIIGIMMLFFVSAIILLLAFILFKSYYWNTFSNTIKNIFNSMGLYHNNSLINSILVVDIISYLIIIVNIISFTINLL
jgi:hypothetical protein